MDFSAANRGLWNPIIQIGIIAGLILLANVLRRKLPLVKKTLMPTAVLAGFILLGIRMSGVIEIDATFLETLTYHAIAMGFIALSLRVPTKVHGEGALTGSKSGALIVSTYLVQAIVGLTISLALAYTVMPELFQASGILLPMAYGQGPGQANNVGVTYQNLGMVGGRSFGLSLAAAGYLCACIVGVAALNLRRKKFARRVGNGKDISGSVTIDAFQDQNEIPVAESIDKLSVQIALVALVYLLTYLFTWGVVSLLEAVAPGVAETVSSLLWGFNFIVGSVIAIGARNLLKGLQTLKLMNRQYQNNYLLSRISGLAFDLMIIAGIASINVEDLTGYWLPFALMAVLGGVVTYLYLRWICRKLYPTYFEEAFFSMYGMLTGTISSGVLLLREIDPDYETPAANNLVSGSSFGIVFGAPVLLLVSFAAKGGWTVPATICIAAVYLAALLCFIAKAGKTRK
ncbi:MAG: sodium:glutamate symporter [Clostridia bacterium]|nr:sodium:glutamate symporter [Clostridia bacterium]